MPTIAEAIAEGARRLSESGILEDRRTASVLLGHVLGVDRARLLIDSKEQIEESRYRQYLGLVERRAAGEPLQYITGHQEFYGLDFIVTPDVLIPRPETELLVERVLKLATVDEKKDNPVIADIGTGSGCIAVTVAFHLPGARVIASDISGAALAVARANAERLGVKDHIEFREGDLFEPFAGLEGALDFVASNPPYVPLERPEFLQNEVRDWEPHVALFGGGSGLDFYRRLLAEGQRYVKPGGYLVCEIGYTQLDAIREMIAPEAWELVDVTSDLQSIPRTLTVRRANGDSE
ncbi:MAG TPA: peptide chain release factor N(5)-glutamine methyltransferase [Blastocatellia bacterium]|nr:peptide chain release factor N(5)-glutamine methyltransferase [Blastocatellia bacterium]